MIDIKFIRSNVELMKTAISNKNEKADLDTLLALDEQRRKLQFDFDTIKARQNSVSQVIAQKKKARENADRELAEMSQVAEEIKLVAANLNGVNEEFDRLLLT
ncbi:MAG TPA: serine--tRNA ligase, partial [Candidatus Cloacimonas sp.]|nr:serine--tRNA ligase [Candidatus Cloacimonas sp.]